jgi:hypothetical protein
VGSPIFDDEKQLRRLYDWHAEGEHVDGLRHDADARGARVTPATTNARRSLAQIADYASRFGVAIGLENRYHFHEFPSTDEMLELLPEYPAGVAGFWLDVGHAEVLDRLGLVPRHRWLNELADRCVGTHVHDVDGLADHRAPGHGTADWDHSPPCSPPTSPYLRDQPAHRRRQSRGVDSLPAGTRRPATDLAASPAKQEPQP